MMHLSRHWLWLLAVLMAGGKPASAAITWNWSFSSEGGQFITDGDLVGADAPPGTYNISDFIVTQSAVAPLGSISGGQYHEGTQVGNGFIWDGLAPTQWFRAGGALTNGSNFFNNANMLFYGFATSGGEIREIGTSDEILPRSPLTLVPIPEPGMALPVLAALALGIRRRTAEPTGPNQSRAGSRKP